MRRLKPSGLFKDPPWPRGLPAWCPSASGLHPGCFRFVTVGQGGERGLPYTEEEVTLGVSAPQGFPERGTQMQPGSLLSRPLWTDASVLFPEVQAHRVPSYF